MNHVLARQACNVGTRPADIAPFDHGNALPLSGQGPGYVLAGFPTAQNYKIVFFQVRHNYLQEMNFKKEPSVGKINT
jgi:hypothetical protein